MQEKNNLLCFLALPLRHKLAAAGVGITIASGFLFWSQHGAARLATTAEVSFDADEARKIEPVAMQANAPAVALAQSILNDGAVQGVAKRTGVKSDAAEFRSHLEMTQPSANSLHLVFHDIERETSVAVANAVANLLVEWKPAPAVPVATAHAPQAAPLMPPAVARPHSNTRSLHSLERPASQTADMQSLEAQLAATDQKIAALDAATAQASTSRRAEVSPRAPSAENDQRWLLEAQLSAAQKKLDDLRLRYTDEYPDVEGAKENIAEIQQNLASLRPTGNEAEPPASPPKPEAPSNGASQLHRKRARLVETIADEKRREAARRDRVASAVDESPALRIRESRLEHPTVDEQVAATLTSQPVLRRQVPAGTNTAQPQEQRPYPEHLDRMGTSPFRVIQYASSRRASDEIHGLSIWLGAALGIICGFIYLAFALRWFRAISDVAILNQILPADIPCLGAIPNMHL
jgi:hypothetical protein